MAEGGEGDFMHYDNETYDPDINTIIAPSETMIDPLTVQMEQSTPGTDRSLRSRLIETFRDQFARLGMSDFDFNLIRPELHIENKTLYWKDLQLSRKGKIAQFLKRFAGGGAAEFNRLITPNPEELSAKEDAELGAFLQVWWMNLMRKILKI